VLNALNEYAGGLRLHSVYLYSSDTTTRETLYHDDVPAAFREQHAAPLREHGFSRIEQATRASKLPLTVTKIRRIVQPIGKDCWIFDLQRTTASATAS